MKSLRPSAEPASSKLAPTDVPDRSSCVASVIDNARRAIFGWLAGKSIEKWAPAGGDELPVEVQSLIAYRNSESEEAQALIASGLDNVRWDLLSDAAKGQTRGISRSGVSPRLRIRRRKCQSRRDWPT